MVRVSKFVLIAVIATAMVSTQAPAQAPGPAIGCWQTFRNAEAIANCTALIDTPSKMTDAERAEAYAGRGLALLHEGDNARAANDFNAAIKLNPKLLYSFYGRGSAEFRMENFDGAIADFDEVIRHGETRLLLLALGGRAAAYRLKGDLERAIADYNEELRHDKARYETHGRLGEAYLAKNDLNRAITEFSLAIDNSLWATNAREYYVWRGKAYLKENEIDKAVADFGSAIAIAPSADAYLGRAEAYRTMGDERAANADIELSQHVAHEPLRTKIP